MEAAGALVSLAPSPITVLGLIPLLALGITYFRYQQYDPESYVSDIHAVRLKITSMKAILIHILYIIYLIYLSIYHTIKN